MPSPLPDTVDVFFSTGFFSTGFFSTGFFSTGFFSTGFFSHGFFSAGFWIFGITCPGSASVPMGGRKVRVSVCPWPAAWGSVANVLGAAWDFCQPPVDAYPAGTVIGHPP